jgi:hypothetical protein
MLRGSGSQAESFTCEQQNLGGCVGKGMERFGKHHGGAGMCRCNKFNGGYSSIGKQSEPDDPGVVRRASHAHEEENVSVHNDCRVQNEGAGSFDPV